MYAASMTDKWTKRFELIRGFAWLAAGGIILGIIALASSGEVRVWVGIFAALLFLPAFFYIYVVVVWHWKDRYRGTHSDLWGALILLENSGWFKLVYVFRHIVPDMRQTGRYRPS
jgi:hypothetical protein